MAIDGLGIHLGHDQRHFGIHPPIAAFVDHHAAALDGPGSEVAGHLVGRAADGQVDAVESRRRELFDRIRPAGELDRLAGRAAGGQKLDVLERKLALGQQPAR